MVEVQLAPIRIGAPYSVDINYPTGFLQDGEGVRTKLRRWVGDTAIEPVDSRDVDTITWELDEAATLTMLPGTYYAEAEIYVTADPDTVGTFLTDNRYVFSCDHGVSETVV